MGRVCVEIDGEIWRKISIVAASERKQKKEVVNEALKQFLDTYVAKFPQAPEETRPSKKIKKK
ncbi:hypothetical protein E308F_31020 [Moorella sp. E308F]|uniref:hypothetical protein n=1 Tax=Moorella sp. E308F TaxID=2572682 RepID=UPI0010FFAEFC|nr:hypothetical protein [Moorella sp. E308F]GEA16856.1 hypothetical protein E308F_31020 [Moorella sp. E308F]